MYFETKQKRCFCASNSTNEVCDPTNPDNAYTAKNGDDCESYCTTECGEGAGSSFACYSTTPLACDAKSTECDCFCLHNMTVPSPIRFGDQCSAFCDREDICDDKGNVYQCSSATKASIIIWTALVAPILILLASLA